MKSQIRAPIAKKVCCRRSIRTKADLILREFDYKFELESSFLQETAANRFTDIEGVYNEVMSILSNLPKLESGSCNKVDDIHRYENCHNRESLSRNSSYY